MSAEVVVRAVGVARTFGSGRNAVVAVHGTTCEAHAGDLIALTGASGSGKTTLLHLLAGLDVPTRGTVEWPAIGSRAQLRPGPIAIIFQAPSLLPPLDVLENVEFPLLLQGIDRDTARQRSIDSLQRLGLEEISSKLPEELSGGQSQRVAAARVLAQRPRLILADEPTGQLDQVNGATVIDTLIAAAIDLHATLIVNTHDTVIADRFDRHWLMSAGRLLSKAPAWS